MENSGRKSDMMKPILLKAGIPLALSLAGIIYSMITIRKKIHVKRSPSEKELDRIETDSEEFHSTSQEQLEDTQIISFGFQDRPIVEEEILGLKNQVSVLIDKHQELGARFLLYCELKEEEIVLMELRNMLVLEIIRSEFCDARLKSIEAENRRVELYVAEYVRVVQQLESAKLENGLLQKKVKRLLRNNRESFRVLHRQSLVLGDREAEVLRCHEELEGRTEAVREMENEIMEMKRMVDELQEEKIELVERLELVESSVSSPSKEVEEPVIEDPDLLLTELEQLRKAQETENEELIYLRWINACLRHELMRIQGKQIHEQEENVQRRQLQDDEKGIHILEYDSDGSSTIPEHDESCSGGHKRVKLLRKLKKWVKRSDGCQRSWDEKEHKHKYLGVQSVSDARKSYSSV